MIPFIVHEVTVPERSANTLGTLALTGSSRAGPGTPFTETCMVVKFTAPTAFCSSTPLGTATLICDDAA